MGPIIQESAASTTLKRVVSKEKIRVKNAENAGPVTTSVKKCSKVKKTGAQLKHGLPGPGQDKDTVSTIQTRGTQAKGGRIKSGSTRNTSKLSSPQEEGASLKPKLRKHLSAQRKEEKRESQQISPCNELDPNRGAMGSNRRALSLPLSPISGLRQVSRPLMQSPPVHTTELLHQHYNQREDDTDSASDLSDSERLPILPSPCTPCTPPHLNLRAEVINTNDFPPDFPGPRGAVSEEDDDEKPSYSYPDFLPPPFNSWSLRQLAVFLHTEGRGAPRPKPVGPLEKYLERLLQLEWLQIQTVQVESSRPPGNRPRPPPGFPSATTPHPPRPHTAPPTRLNSPKGARHGQRAFPFAHANNPPSPASAQPQHSRFPVCPHCHIRYPLCNGSCSAYAYQRHSRLSPLLEQKTRPGAPPAKRSSSESRANSSEGRAAGGGGSGAQTPVSPSAGRSHLKHMQAVGNVRKPSQESCATTATASNIKSQVRKSRVRANSETDVKKDSAGAKATSVEKRVCSGSKREVNTVKRAEKDWQRAEGGQASKTSTKRAAKEPSSLSKATLATKQNGKAKNVHFLAK